MVESLFEDLPVWKKSVWFRIWRGWNERNSISKIGWKEEHPCCSSRRELGI